MTNSLRCQRRPRVISTGVVVIVMTLFAGCSGQSNDGVTAISLDSSPITSTTTDADVSLKKPSDSSASTAVVDVSHKRLSAGILSYYSTSRKTYLRSIFNAAKADCMATDFLKIPGYRSIIEQSSDPVDYEQLASPPDEATNDAAQRPLWRCLTVAEIVQEVYGQNGDCCRDIYPESTLACVTEDLANLDKEELISELLNYFLGRPLGTDYAARITGCGISVAQ